MQFFIVTSESNRIIVNGITKRTEKDGRNAAILHRRSTLRIFKILSVSVDRVRRRFFDCTRFLLGNRIRIGLNIDKDTI